MNKGRRLFYRFITDKITQTDLSGYLTQYPPLFTWKPFRSKDVLQAWAGRQRDERLGVYVHIPFCEQKCSYCRYFSRDSERPGVIAEYMRALFKEMRIYSPVFKGRKFRTLYIGGGTPSVLAASQLEGLFDALEKNFSLERAVQICVEVNPASVDERKLRILKKRGVNRLTIGVQSLSRAVLRAVNRRQPPEQALDCIALAKSIGFETVNIDLMAGLPGESAGSFLSGLRRILELRPDMIHIHPFYPTKHTRFIEQGDALDGRMIGARDNMCRSGSREALAHGYKGISFDALGLKEKDRNVQLADAVETASSFLGLGACAVSHVKSRLRYVNEADIPAYMKRLRRGFLPISQGVPVGKKEEMIYYIVAVLRYGPLDKKEFKELFGEEVNARFRDVLDDLKRAGRLRETGRHITLDCRDLEEYAVYSKRFYDSALLAPFQDEFYAWSKKKAPAYL